MDRLAILVNDAGHAQPVLEPLLSGPDAIASTIVLCPPKLTHRVGKWLSNRQRQQWQRSWADKTRRELLDRMPNLGVETIDWTVATTRLSDTTTQLRRHLGAGLRLLDLRRPTLGNDQPQVDFQGGPSTEPRGDTPAAAAPSLPAAPTVAD